MKGGLSRQLECAVNRLPPGVYKEFLKGGRSHIQIKSGGNIRAWLVIIQKTEAPIAEGRDIPRLFRVWREAKTDRGEVSGVILVECLWPPQGGLRKRVRFKFFQGLVIHNHTNFRYVK